MRRKRTLSLGISVVLTLALPLSQAFAHEFEGSATGTQTASTMTMEFIISAGAIKCKNMEVQYATSTGTFANLTLTITKLEKCKLNGAEVGAGPNGCKFELSSSGVTEPSSGFFQNGSAGFKCSSALGFETAHCGVTVESQTPLSAYEWENIRTTSPFESELTLRLAGVKYKVTGTGCGTSGSNGEFHAGIILPAVIIK